MIDPAVLRHVILDNRERIRNACVFERQFETAKGNCCIYTGGKYSGKTYALYQKIQAALASGIDLTDIVYVNFEDPRLRNFEFADFERLLDAHRFLSRTQNPPMLFLDEIHLADHWQKFIRQMRKAGLRIHATSSRTSLLTEDAVAKLGKGVRVVRVLPPDFRERLAMKGISHDAAALDDTLQSGKIAREFLDYLDNGGFLRVVVDPDPNVIHEIFNHDYFGDMVQRYAVSMPDAFLLLLRLVAQNIGQALSFTRLARMLDDADAHLAKTTVIGYVENAIDAGLLLPIRNYAVKLDGKESVPKYYFVDNGILSLLKPEISKSSFENIVALELMRRYGTSDQVFFWKKKAAVDFYVPAQKLAVSVATDSDMLKEKPEALVNAAKILPCRKLLLLTAGADEGTLVIGDYTVDVMPIWKWLLNSEN
ncbi:MAG: ATP-binding protein [Sutterellaceae bacterium]|nr:ATP-binding protein [Sutterellaceae bacterium]